MAQVQWTVVNDPADLLTVGSTFFTMDIAYTLHNGSVTVGTQLQNGKLWTVHQKGNVQYLLAEDGTKVRANENRLNATKGAIMPKSTNKAKAQRRLDWMAEQGGVTLEELIEFTGVRRRAAQQWLRNVIKSGFVEERDGVYFVCDGCHT